VTVHLEPDPDCMLSCPLRSKATPSYDTRRHRLRHPDTCQYRTVLVTDVPCAEHGVHQIDIPWSERSTHFTALFEVLAITG